MKKVLLILIAVCLLVTGCKKEDEYYEDCKEFALIKLKEKYGEDFVYVRPSTGGGNTFGVGTPTFFVQTTDPTSPVNNQEVYVRVDEDSNGNKIVSDDYVALRYKEKVQELLESLAKKYFNDIEFVDGYRYKNRGFLTYTNLTKKTTFEEFLLDDETDIYATIEIKESDFDYNKLVQLKDDLNNNLNKAWILFYVTKNEFFGNYSEDLDEMLSHNDYSKKVIRGNINISNGEAVMNIYRENIVVEKYSNQIKEYLNNVVTQNFPNAIFNEFSYDKEEPYDLDTNISFEDYLNREETYFNFSYGVNQNEYSKQILDNIINEFSKLGFRFNFDLYILDDEFNEETDKPYSPFIGYPYIQVNKSKNGDISYQMKDFK